VIRAAATLLAILLVIPVRGDDEDSIGGKTTSQWVQLLQTSKQVKARQAAVIALEHLGPKTRGVLPALTDALAKDPEPDIRQAIAQAIGRMGPDARPAIEALGQAVRDDKSARVREAAAQALGGRMVPHSKIAVLILADALRDPEPGPRQAAAKTLRDLGEEARPALPRLSEVARDRKLDRFTRAYAVQLVSRLGAGSDAAVELLTTVFADKDGPPSVRVAAADALGRCGPAAEPAVPALAAALKGGPLEVRRSAAAALCRIGPAAQAAWPQIKIALGDEDATLRSEAIRVAGVIGKQQPQVVPMLARIAVEDANLETRLAAIQELGQLGDAARDAAPALSRLAAHDPRASVRDAADAALKKVKANP
jgi:HEAT repeat protein